MLIPDEPFQIDVPTTPVQLSGRSGAFNLQAICPGQVIYLGTSSDVTTLNGWPLYDGSFYSPRVDDLSVYWAVANGGGCKLACWGHTER